jgi:hypothetical protein
MATYHQRMQEIFRRYQAEVSEDPADLEEVGAWAIRKNLWQPRPADINAQFAEEMAAALREEYRVDEAGRHYRAKHAVRSSRDGRQLSLWADIDTAPRAHMEKAFAQRRRQVVHDCHQLKVDVDHFNGIHPDQEQLPLILDFEDDVREMMIAEGIKGAAD